MNNFNKKLEIKRLLIYLALTFGLTWGIFGTFIATGHKWDGTKPYLESFVGLGMMVPVIAHVLTRKLTGEGFAMTGKGSMMLGITFRDKKWIYYLFAMLVPWLYFELGDGLSLLFYPQLFDEEYYQTLGLAKELIPILPFIEILNGTILSFAAFGEEGGWRGYMMPKLTALFGIKKAVVIGGIIWGVWHAPLTAVGHNFGTDYPGFPYLGILVMCVECSFMGIMLTFLTEKTGSVWAASIMHAVNNTHPGILGLFLNEERVAEDMPHPLLRWVFLLIPTVVIGSLCLASLRSPLSFHKL
jgi:membrane protease YdiL (CAAX protease family)